LPRASTKPRTAAIIATSLFNWVDRADAHTPAAPAAIARSGHTQIDQKHNSTGTGTAREISQAAARVGGRLFNPSVPALSGAAGLPWFGYQLPALTTSANSTRSSLPW